MDKMAEQFVIYIHICFSLYTHFDIGCSQMDTNEKRCSEDSTVTFGSKNRGLSFPNAVKSIKSAYASIMLGAATFTARARSIVSSLLVSLPFVMNLDDMILARQLAVSATLPKNTRRYD